jgi:hypothetical protein
MRLLKILAVFFGLVFALAGLASVGAGGFGLSVYRSNVGPAGFVESPVQEVGSNGFALTAPDVNGQVTGTWEKWGLAHARTMVRITGSSKLPAPIFVGVAPTAKVSKYLAGVARDRITSVDLAAGSVHYEHVDGTSVPGPPGNQDFWVATASGTGTRTLEWALEEGDWAIVIMNADASAPVAADVTLAARFGIVIPAIVGLIAGGVAVLAIGVALVVIGARTRRGGRE